MTAITRIAIVGAGPAGCYTAQAVHKTLPDADITVIDCLPVPYGLVRYGVAADHQGTKAVTRQFARLFEREHVRFVGNVSIGHDVTLPELRAAFDGVVLAHGLHKDRTLDIPGAHLPHVYGAGQITRLFNAHPAEHGRVVDLGATVAIVGCGNVAIDVIRLLAKPASALTGSDIDDEAHTTAADRLRAIHVVARSTPGDSRFDPDMVREIAELDGVAHNIDGTAASAATGATGATVVDRRLQAIAALPRDVPNPTLRVHWWFGATPAHIHGYVAADAITIATDGGPRRIDVDSVITAIGFQAAAGEDLVTLTNGARRTGRVESGLYVAGWARTGPRGTIPEQRTHARQLATLVADDLHRHAPIDRADPPGFATGTGYDGWTRIDEHETHAALVGRVRRKVSDPATLLALARKPPERLTRLPPVSGALTLKADA